ncbi:MAG: hypothetical protein CME30_03040, partial [Gemmatimonadetes bacterium]|nr:hypothetical protein [Gemmatimonadota bacterium]
NVLRDRTRRRVRFDQFDRTDESYVHLHFGEVFSRGYVRSSNLREDRRRSVNRKHSYSDVI